MSENYPDDQQVKDLKAMIAADRKHMHEALEDGNYRAADRFREAVSNNKAELRHLRR